MKSKPTATLLALFLGWFGIHKFYLGKWVQGILYFLFAWTFIPYIISFVEFIRYVCMSDAEFSQRFDGPVPFGVPSPPGIFPGNPVTGQTFEVNGTWYVFVGDSWILAPTPPMPKAL